VKEQVRISKLKSAVTSIRTCKNEDLIPTFARFRLANSRIADAKLKQKCASHILQAEMRYKQCLLSRTAKYLKRLDAELKQSVSHIVYIRLQSISQEIVTRTMSGIESTHETKLDVLRANKIGRASQRQILDPVTNCPHQILDPVTNLLKYILTDSEHAALINGLNHVYPPEKLDQPQLVCNMEYFYARLLNVRTAYRHYEKNKLLKLFVIN